MGILKEMAVLLQTRYDFFTLLTLEHLCLSLLAILFAAIIGLILGIFISNYQKIAKPVLNLVNIIYTIPSISLLGLLILFTGIGNVTAIIALTVYALLPMVRNTYTGLTNINPAIIEAARGMGSTDWQLLYKIKLPLALPVIMSALRNMATMTIALAGIASFIGAGGLGVAIFRGITTNNLAMTAVGSILTAALAFLVDALLGRAEKSMAARKKTSVKKVVLLLVILPLLICIVFHLITNAGQEKDTVKIATKPMTEQYILGEMLKLIIEQDTGLAVALTQGVGGGTANIHPAVIKGDFDIYPEYTGTGWNAVLKKQSLYNEALFKQLQEQYEKDYNLTWLGAYGFNNTYGLAVRKEIARQHNIKTFSDLTPYSSMLVFGAEADFYEREDGYKALCEKYSYNFKTDVDLDIGLKYRAIKAGQIDVMNIFTTDGLLSVAEIEVLKDDKHFYPSYRCANVVRLDTLQKYPQLASALLKLQDKISDAQMARMNYLVESEGKEPKEVAKEFLQQQKLLKGE